MDGGPRVVVMVGHPQETDCDLGQVRHWDALDRLHWEARYTRRSYGIWLEVRATSVFHRNEIDDVLPPGRHEHGHGAAQLPYSIVWGQDSDGPDTDGEHWLFFDRVCLYRGSDPDELVSMLHSDATWRVATHSLDGTFIHAGAVTHSDIGLVLPGSSGAGKSTLVTQLLRLGARYYSDEYAVIDERGRLHPFPSLIRLKEPPRAIRRVRPQELGARIGEEPSKVGLIAFPAFMADSDFRIEELTRSQASLYLLQHMPAARISPEAALTAATAATANATCIRVQYGESAQAAAALVGLVQGDTSKDL